MMIDFSKKRFLVVDDFSEFRSSIRGILRLLAVQDIDTAANGNEVLELCRRNRYDVILHDYNLGDGLNGQQVLELLHAEKLLPPHCIFIMVTAENTQAMVLAALECQPDDYLTKPFNKVALQTRLERLIRRKRVLKPVLDAKEANNPTGVLQACLAIEQQEPRHAVLCHTYMADALCELGRYKDLEQLLETQARSRPSSWNLQALARLWLRQGRLEQVNRLLNAAIRQFPMMPELHDIRAELAALQNDFVGTLDALREAVALSPNTLRRQINLASQAWLSGDHRAAQLALRRCWEVARYAVSFDPELLWLQASILAQGSVESTQTRLPEDVEHWLNLTERAARQTPKVQPAATVLRLEEQRRKGHPPSSADLSDLTAQLNEHKYEYSAITLLQLGDWLARFGETDAAEALWVFCAKRHAGTAMLLEHISTRCLALDLQPLAQALLDSRQAAALHYQEQFDEAQALFTQALQKTPELVELNMAAARLFSDQLTQQNTQAERALNQCFQRINSLSTLEPDSADFIRMQSALELTPW